MNILPKKSWHVGNKDNIARVRKDEEQARLEEQRKQERIHAAEKERRLQALRSKSAGSKGAQPELERHQQPSHQHVNLFAEEEREQLERGENEEYLQEKQEAKKRAERPFTMYLDQASKEPLPWYAAERRQQSSLHSTDAIAVAESIPSPSDGNLVKWRNDERRKQRHDPLRSIKHSLAIVGKPSAVTNGSALPPSTINNLPQLSSSSSSSSYKSSIEQLRQERLQREQEERRRVDILLGRSQSPTTTPGDEQTAAKSNKQKYNSQFHPELSNQKRRRY